VLKARIRSIGRRGGEGEVVINVAGVDGSRRLGKNLSALHRLTVPERGAILNVISDISWQGRKNTHDGRLETKGISGVGRVLVTRRDGEVLGGSTRAVDVPLPWGDLVAPAPFVEVRHYE
jgi:hypothetical protein